MSSPPIVYIVFIVIKESIIVLQMLTWMARNIEIWCESELL